MLFLQSLVSHQRVQRIITIGGILTVPLERLDTPALVLDQHFALRFAAERPQDVSGLILYGTYASGPDAFPDKEIQRSLVSLVRAHWGMGSNLLADLYQPGARREVVSHIARLMRGSMVEVLHSNYVRTARAKGLPGHLIVTRHALRAALLPLISYLGPAVAGLVTGSLIVEQIFGLPGIGRYFVVAALNRDYTLVLGVVIFYATIIILLNLVADLLYAVLDPRVSTSA